MDSKQDELPDRRQRLVILVIGIAVLGFILSLALGSQFLTPVVSFVFSGAVLAAIVAGIFQIVSDRTATKRARMQVDLEKRLDAIQNMWKFVDKQMRKYYFPIATAAGGLSDTLVEWRDSPVDSVMLKIFYWFVRFRLSSVEMLKNTTFFILTNYLAEQCATSLHDKITAAPGLSTLDLSLLSKTFSGSDFSLYQLNEKIEGDKQTKATYDHFRDWIRAKSNKVDDLEKEAGYFRTLITVEINRLYEQWYGTPYEVPPGKSVEEIAKYLELT